jgi:hypothetical protein
VKYMLLALAQEEPPPALVETIYRETEGNPLFVEEFVKLMIEEERLFDTAGNWRTDLAPKTLQLPRGVSLVIERRLQRLGLRSREALTTAAVIGRHFRYDLLETAGALKSEALLEAVDEAEDAHLIQAGRVGGHIEFTFAHELIRQTLYRELSLLRRQRVHLQVADAMEGIYALRLDEHAAELAYHYTEAGTLAEPAKLYRYLVLEGNQAMAASAFEEALRCYERAGTLVSPGTQQRADLLWKLGTAQHSAGEWNAAAITWNETVSAYEALGDVEGAERTCDALTLLHTWHGQIMEALQVAQKGLTIAPESGSEPRCRLLSLTGVMLSIGHHPAAAEPLIDQALAIAERRGDAGLLGNVLATRGVHQRMYVQFQECFASLTRAEDLLRSANDLAGLARCYNYQAPLLGYLGMHAEAERALDELQVLANKLGDPAGMAMHALVRAILALVRGEFAAADTWAQDAEERARQAARLALPSALQLRAEIAFLTGCWEAVEPLTIEATHIYEEMGCPPTGYVGPLCLLRYRAERGDHEGAQALLPELQRLGELGQPASSAAFDAMVTAALSLAALDMKQHAAAIYPLLLAMADKGVVFAGTSYPLLQRVLGMLASTNAWWDRASTHYDTALQQADRARATKEATETYDHYARMLLARNQSGDRDRGHALLERAIHGYGDIGMPSHLEKARQLRDQYDGAMSH